MGRIEVAQDRVHWQTLLLLTMLDFYVYNKEGAGPSGRAV
jgi:hypothetical protein